MGFPIWGGPRQGELAPLQAALSGLEASTRWPSPGPETPPLSLWVQKPQGRGLWGPHGTQAFREVPGEMGRGQAGPAGAAEKDTLVSLRSTSDPSSAAVPKKPSE